MRLKRVRVAKEFKCGLPNFSNITARCDLSFEVEEGEEVDWTAIWDEVNRQLYAQAGTVDPSWIDTKEYQNYFKTIIKTPKEAK